MNPILFIIFDFPAGEEVPCKGEGFHLSNLLSNPGTVRMEELPPGQEERICTADPGPIGIHPAVSLFQECTLLFLPKQRPFEGAYLPGRKEDDLRIGL
jgi:hypothetical protein